MPVIGTTRDKYSELVKQTGKIEIEGACNYYFARITVTADGAGDTPIDAIGFPVIWDDLAGEWHLFGDGAGTTVAAAIAAGDSDLPNGAKFAIIVGGKEGKGFNQTDITITDAGTEVTVLFRGEAVINGTGIEWDAGADATERADFSRELEKQGIAILTSADVVDPYFVEA